MKILVIATFSALVAISTTTSAHPRMSHDQEGRIFGKAARSQAFAYAGEPKVRIRGVADGGLTPLAFADWLVSHPHANPSDVNLRRVASSTKRLNRAAPLFAAADLDGNGRVSAAELAKFVTIRDV